MFMGFAPFFNSKRQPTLDEALAEAGQLAESGQARLAITKLKSLENQYGANARYHAAIGTLRDLAGGDQTAAESFERALDLARQDQLSHIQNDVAYCLAINRFFGQAIEGWNVCLELDPENAIARINLARYSARLAYERKDTPGMLSLKEAMLAADEVSKIYPENMHIAFAAAYVHSVAVQRGVGAKPRAEYHVLRALRLGNPAEMIQGVPGFAKIDWADAVDDAMLDAFGRGHSTDAKWSTHTVLAQLTSAQYILDIHKK